MRCELSACVCGLRTVRYIAQRVPRGPAGPPVIGVFRSWPESLTRAGIPRAPTVEAQVSGPLTPDPEPEKLVGISSARGIPMTSHIAFCMVIIPALFTAAVAHGSTIMPRLRSGVAVGSMVAGSPVLTVTGPSPFNPGDPVIVEIGGEVGQGKRGTIGVGGVFPSSDPNPAAYYKHLDVPKALIAKIVSVDGAMLTLDKPAVAATKGANVYLTTRRSLMLKHFGMMLDLSQQRKA